MMTNEQKRLKTIKIGQNRTKNYQKRSKLKNDPKMIKIGPKTIKIGSKTVKIGSRMIKIGPKIVKIEPKTVKIGSKTVKIDNSFWKMSEKNHLRKKSIRKIARPTDRTFWALFYPCPPFQVLLPSWGNGV